jgi:hypothetical protein
MHNFQHKRIIEKINRLDTKPSDPQTYAEWIKGGDHLALLRENARADDVVMYACGDYTFIYSLVVPNDRVSPPDKSDFLGWSCNPFRSIASYVYGGGRDDVWLERGLSHVGAKTLDGATQLIFGRTFEGWSGQGGTYFELNQEYTHVTGIHFRPEFRAWCRFDENGDLMPVVSVTDGNDKTAKTTLLTFKWEPLEEYLAITKSSLVRMFDFTLLDRQRFTHWPKGDEELVEDASDFFYRRKIVPSHAAYTRGVQIVRLRRSAQEAYDQFKGGGTNDRKYASFIAWDWRNKCITRISTDPKATTNYFEAEHNARPFELSPAFFRPEVLSKYKTDRDKYTLRERDLTCRSAWHLRGIDVNAAGQVHAYICDLRNLPYSEQLHWQSYNEEPKTGLAERAFTSDFKGEFSDLPNPLATILSVTQRWNYDRVQWWALRDDKLPERVNTPLTTSRDEWAEAFMDLAKLVVEGFETKFIRAKLDETKIPYTNEDRTIALLEKIVHKNASPSQRLQGLRMVQNLRSKAKGHVSGSEAEELAQQALMEHETFGNHFRQVCALVVNDLEAIERAFS